MNPLPTVSLHRDRSRILWAALAAFGIGVLSLVVPLVSQAAVIGMALALLLCWGLPMWYQWSRGTLDFFEPVHSVGFIYFLYFGLGAILTLYDPQRVAYDRYVLEYIPLAVLLCLLGYLTFLCGYYLPWKGRRPGRLVQEIPRGALFLIPPATLGFLGFMAQAFWYRASKLGLAIGGLISSLGQLAPLFIFAWAMAWLIYFSGKSTRSIRLLLFAFMCPASLLIITNQLNNKSLIVALGLVPLMGMWYAKHRIPWATLTVLALLVIFVVFPFNNTFRTLDNRIPIPERMELTMKLIGDWDIEHYFDRSLGTFGKRIALVNSMGVVLRDVPRWVPYASGRTMFRDTLTFFIPRVLWPDKPALEFGREFGETFRVVHILDDETNMAVTVPAELYWNYGVAGVIFGMAAWGLLLRLYYRTYGEAPDLDPIRRAIHLVLLIQILEFESGIAFTLVIIIRTLMVIEVYRFLGRRFGLVQRVSGGRVLDDSDRGTRILTAPAASPSR